MPLDVPARLTVVPSHLPIVSDCADLDTEYTFDELRELPFQIQLGAEFSELD